MRNYNMILIEKRQKYHLRYRNKYEYLTGEEILSSNQKQIIEQAKFTYSPLEKDFEKNKNNWRWRKKTSGNKGHGKQLVKSNEVFTKTTRYMKKQKDEIFDKFSSEKTSEIYYLSQKWISIISLSF